MLAWQHGGGFSLDASVRIAADDRDGLERLLRYCARPPFALERLELIDEQQVIYRLPRTQRDGTTALSLTPLELIDQLAGELERVRRAGPLVAPELDGAERDGRVAIGGDRFVASSAAHSPFYSVHASCSSDRRRHCAENIPAPMMFPQRRAGKPGSTIDRVCCEVAFFGKPRLSALANDQSLGVSKIDIFERLVKCSVGGL
mgnify:CR=1 FL=1